ncbi:hypothetical protein Tco_1323942 [Tanacetum coccineum]
MDEGSTIPSTSQPQKTLKPRKNKRKDIEIPQSSGTTEHVADEVIYMERDDRLVRAATTASSLEAEQDSGNITKTRSKETPNEHGSQGTSSDGGPRSQETIGNTIAQTWFENVSKTSNDSLLVGARVASSGEESLGEEDVSKQERKINDIDADEGVTLVDETAENLGMFNDEEIFDAGILDCEEVFANAEQEVAAVNEVTTAGIEKVVSTAEVTTAGIEKVVSTAGIEKVVSIAEVTTIGIEVTTASAITTTANDLTLAQTLMEIRSARPKLKGVMIQEQGESTTTTRPQQQPSKDKGKGIMVEPEKPTKRKVQIKLDEEAAQRLQAELQAELEEEERLAREKEKEANIALIES